MAGVGERLLIGDVVEDVEAQTCHPPCSCLLSDVLKDLTPERSPRYRVVMTTRARVTPEPRHECAPRAAAEGRLNFLPAVAEVIGEVLLNASRRFS